MTKEEVLARLRATQEKGSKTEYQDGKGAGRRWAEKLATAAELQRLEQFRCEHEGWGDADSGGFVFIARPQSEGERYATSEFWQSALGDDSKRIEDEDFFCGFGDGAMQLWNEVKNDL